MPRGPIKAAPVGECTLIAPFYRNTTMLRRQMEDAWQQDGFNGWRIIVVDDGSPEPAFDVFSSLTEPTQKILADRLRIYRIGVDIPWNRGGARNLGAYVCETEWMVHVDIDHILPAPSAAYLLKEVVAADSWVRFPRWRVGKADDTRRKDSIPPDCELGQIHPHVDSYLITKTLYWRVGGYNENYSGCLGGGSAFLKQLERRAGPPKLFRDEIRLDVLTRSEVADASDWSLSRDPTEYKQRKRLHPETEKATNPLRFPWERVL